MQLIDDLAATFQLDRSDLNVVRYTFYDLGETASLASLLQRAASKGLVCGAGLVMHLASDEVVHVNDFEVCVAQFIYFKATAYQRGREHSFQLEKTYPDLKLTMTLLGSL